MVLEESEEFTQALKIWDFQFPLPPALLAPVIITYMVGVSTLKDSKAFSLIQSSDFLPFIATKK